MKKKSRKVNKKFVLDETLITSHYRACSYLSKFAINQNGSCRKMLLCCYDKTNKRWQHNGLPIKTEDLLFEKKSFMKFAENCFSETETSFSKILAAILKMNGICEILPYVDNFFQFIAMEIARNPKSIDILTTITPDIATDIKSKSATIIQFIPRLAHALEHQLCWSYWLVEAGNINNPLICPDTIFVSCNITNRLVSYMIIPISYSHCIIALKDREVAANGGLSIFDADLLNYLSFIGSEKFFVADEKIHVANISDLNNFSKAVRNNPNIYGRFVGWTTHQLLKTETSGLGILKIK
jgi:hypothetical protein